jgi:hypothetical protein
MGDTARTAFQTGAPFSPELDIQSDQAIVYGANASLAERVASWRAAGYETAFMTGISWGGYEAYYGADPRRVAEEIQTDASGTRFMHGNSTTVGYNVPTPAYLDFLKQHITPALDLGLKTFYLEEPEYWARTGWSEGFKTAWQRHYKSPWVAPDTSVDAQFKASRLKYELYHDALREIFQFIKSEGKARGFETQCLVPTHSLLNYAHWRIVSPESRLMDLDTADGYIAQVWTGTARTPNKYAGVVKERTFETAFLEYGQMLSMVRPTGRKVWFLADPVEDDPHHTWTDYERNYKLTLTASLMWPDSSRYEVMPWPNRIFRGKYPVEEGNLDNKAPLPPKYSVTLMACINALNDMEQEDIHREMGTPGIGVLVSDTLMFQRAKPHPSDPQLGTIYGLALPLLKHGVPVEPVQLEQILQPNALDSYRVLLLSYEGQKPLRPEYHDALARWVRKGGALIVVGDGEDPYHHVEAWWNADGETNNNAYDDLFQRLGIDVPNSESTHVVNKGQVRLLENAPRRLQRSQMGAEAIRNAVADVLTHNGSTLQTQNYLLLRRGPYVIGMGLDESIEAEPRILTGSFIDLFDSELALRDKVILTPGVPQLLYDLDKAPKDRVLNLVASTRIRNLRKSLGNVAFESRGPNGTKAIAWLRIPSKPRAVQLSTGNPAEYTWDPMHGLIQLRFTNTGKPMEVAVTIEDELGSRQ